MDDAFTMTTAFFDSFYPPFLNGRGESQPRRLASPPANCTMCGEPLIEMEFSKGFEFVCDNWKCHLFRRPQGYKEKEPHPKPNKAHTNGILRPGYPYYLEQKKENYHLLRGLGIGSKEAARMTSNKRTREIEEQARLGNTQLALLRGY